jgi:hypothetical protein
LGETHAMSFLRHARFGRNRSTSRLVNERSCRFATERYGAAENEDAAIYFSYAVVESSLLVLGPLIRFQSIT